MDALQIARTRYTTKHYDPARRVSDEDFDALLEVLRLSPSSVNSQPWEFFIARTAQARDKIMPAILDFNRDRVRNASHVVVFAVHEKLDEQYLQDLLAQEAADGRYAKTEALQGQDAGRRHFVGLHSVSEQELLSWEMRQAYIAQGFVLFAMLALLVTVLFVLMMVLTSYGIIPKKLVLTDSTDNGKGYTAVSETELKEGDKGTALTQLRPAGKAKFGEKTVDVVSEGEFIEVGTKIVVISVVGNKITVKPDSE